MVEFNQQKNAEAFAAKWKDRGSERGECQPFWLDLLRNVFGVVDPESYICFEVKPDLDSKKFIDGYIESTHVLIEQKSIDVDLDEAVEQSDGTKLTAFQQAQRYGNAMRYSMRPRWIITCNFKQFHIHDMEYPDKDPEVLLLEDFPRNYRLLNLLVEEQNEKIRKERAITEEASALVGRLYDALLKQYTNKESEKSLRSLNMLCVRIVFCLYAESAGVFDPLVLHGEHGQQTQHKLFHAYLQGRPASGIRKALRDLFWVLNQKVKDRDPYLKEDDPILALFPYVDGGLFADMDVEIPPFDEKLRKLLVEEVSAGFDWSQISPSIFGAVFESTVNPNMRRAGGMHYTNKDNIHKVIDTLFLDDLKEELAQIEAIPVPRTRKKQLTAFQNKLSSLTFLDPACGSGNFLTESYLSLRRLENKVIRDLTSQVQLGMTDPIKVSIDQFYGIEVNDFAVSVARTALWIAEIQMTRETADIVIQDLPSLPLQSSAHIVEGNALRLDWKTVIQPKKLSYIMGNPPFSGAHTMTKKQKEELVALFPRWKNAGNLDYVCGWYKKAADMMQGTTIRAALVSTNSITQGESVANLWKPLFDDGVHIDFAYRNFRWSSNATNPAQVHCVIIGFSCAASSRPKLIFDGLNVREAKNINGYLLDADNIFVESRSKPICNVPEIGIGNKPIDGGYYLFTEKERDAFLQKEPAAAKWFHPWYGGKEFLNGKPRYCLWLGECTPNELSQMPECIKRVEAVREYRQHSNSPETQRLAETPTQFHVQNIPKAAYLAIPEVSSEKRDYVPMAFMTADVLCSNLIKIVPKASPYHFGVLTSNVHMAWMRAVCGRLKSDYRYSKNVVYNNFPWPEPTEAQRTKIERTAQAILDAREQFGDTRLDKLYDNILMPVELRKAHRQNDRAVMAAYGFQSDMEESEIIEALLERYRLMTSNL